jgi:hypothetical protein
LGKYSKLVHIMPVTSSSELERENSEKYPVGAMVKFLGNSIIRSVVLGVILLAWGCAGGTYAAPKAAHLGAYEDNPAGKAFGPSGG